MGDGMFKIRHRTFFPTAVTVGFQSKWVPRGLSFHAKGAATSQIINSFDSFAI